MDVPDDARTMLPPGRESWRWWQRCDSDERCSPETQEQLSQALLCSPVCICFRGVVNQQPSHLTEPCFDCSHRSELEQPQPTFGQPIFHVSDAASQAPPSCFAHHLTNPHLKSRHVPIQLTQSGDRGEGLHAEGHRMLIDARTRKGPCRAN